MILRLSSLQIYKDIPDPPNLSTKISWLTKGKIVIQKRGTDYCPIGVFMVFFGGGYGHEVRQGVAAKARELVHEGADDDHGHSLPKRKSLRQKVFQVFVIQKAPATSSGRGHSHYSNRAKPD